MSIYPDEVQLLVCITESCFPIPEYTRRLLLGSDSEWRDNLGRHIAAAYLLPEYVNNLATAFTAKFHIGLMRYAEIESGK